MTKKKTEQNASRGAWQDPEGKTVPQDRTDGGMRVTNCKQKFSQNPPKFN